MIIQDYGEGEIGFPPLLAAFLPMITSAFKGGGAPPGGAPAGGGSNVADILSSITSALRPAAPPTAVAPAPAYMPAPQYYAPPGGPPGCAPGSFRSARYNICWSPSQYPNEAAAFRAFQAQSGGGAMRPDVDYDDEGMPIRPGMPPVPGTPGYPQPDTSRARRTRGHGRRRRGRHMRGFEGLGAATSGLSPGWSTALLLTGGALAAAGAIYGFSRARRR